MDTLDGQQRSARMSLVRAKNTKPVGAWAARFDEWMADSGFVKH